MALLRNLVIYILIISSFQFCTQSCTRGANPIPVPITPPDSIPKPDIKDPVDTTVVIPDTSTNQGPQDPKIMKFEIEFSGVPKNASVTVSKLKYNKANWLSIEWDDNSLESLKGYAELNKKFYTDGCGNKINYSAALAVNGKNQYNNEEAGLLSHNVTYTQMKQLIGSGWDIENHSYYHDPTGNYNFGTDRAKNVSELENLILTRINYKMNGLVVPTNYDGFPTAAKNFGYLFSTSQGTFDQFPPAGTPTYKDVQNFDLAPINFSSFNRIFYDNWNEMNKAVTAAFKELITKNNHYFRFASHGIDLPIFIQLLELFERDGNDKILIVPTREVMEYRLVANLPITQKLTGNKLEVTINLTTLPERVRWRDLSFVVSTDSKIANIKSMSNIDKISFNKDNNLVNVFKQITNWK